MHQVNKPYDKLLYDITKAQEVLNKSYKENYHKNLTKKYGIF